MLTIEEVNAHCRDVGRGIEKAVADGMDLNHFEKLGLTCFLTK